MKYIIDRIESDIAVCEREDGQMENIPIAQITGEVHEGDTLIVADGCYQAVPTQDKTNQALFDRLFKKK